jgi:hypothetical protein
MSWDLSVESRSGPMGTPEEIRSKIDGVLPGVDWSDPTCGFLEQDGYSLEFSILGDEGDEYEDDMEGVEEAGETDLVEEREPQAPLTGFMIAVRGEGAPLPPIVDLCKTCGWALADAGSGEEIDLDDPSDDGWREFQAFRNRVADSAAVPKPGIWGRLFGRKD